MISEAGALRALQVQLLTYRPTISSSDLESEILSGGYSIHLNARDGVPLQGLGGYVQSKLVAEMLVRRVGGLGLPAVVYRPGICSSDSELGVCNRRDMLPRFLTAMAMLKTYPDIPRDVTIRCRPRPQPLPANKSQSVAERFEQRRSGASACSNTRRGAERRGLGLRGHRGASGAA